MPLQNIRICPGCGNVVTLRDQRKKYCNRLCYRGGEYRIDYLRRVLADATPDKCIEWPYGKNDKGYGTLRYNGKPHPAHHLSYELFVGPLIGEECALHKCDNRPCVNYLHLFKGTRADNNADMIAKGRDVHNPVPALCKLTPEQVEEIRTRWKPRCNMIALETEFGVSRQQIYRILTGESRITIGEFTPAYVKRKLLTLEQLADIYKRFIPYSNAEELAQEYGITANRVKQIGRTKRYACKTK